MIVRSEPSRFPLWAGLIVWIVVSAAAYSATGLIFHFPSGFPPNNGASLNTGAFVIGLLQGGFSGLVIGSLQALMLRQYFTGVRAWIAANVFSLAIVHAIGDALPDPIALPVVQALGGIVMGISVWRALGGQRLNLVICVIVMGIAWFAGLTLGLTVMKQIAKDWQTHHIVVGVTTGFAVSLATGVLLAQIANRPANDQVEA